jgi:hypothetical protein
MENYLEGSGSGLIDRGLTAHNLHKGAEKSEENPQSG